MNKIDRIKMVKTLTLAMKTNARKKAYNEMLSSNTHDDNHYTFLDAHNMAKIEELKAAINMEKFRQTMGHNN